LTPPAKFLLTTRDNAPQAAFLMGIHASIHLTEEPTCPPGTTFNKKDCVSTQGPSCPQGLTYSRASGIYSERPTCPPGVSFDGANCVFTEAPECPHNTSLNERVCTSSQFPSCHPETTFSGKLVSGPNTLRVQREQHSTERCVFARKDHNVLRALCGMVRSASLHNLHYALPV
jgi:hypothetical protein